MSAAEGKSSRPSSPTRNSPKSSFSRQVSPSGSSSAKASPKGASTGLMPPTPASSSAKASPTSASSAVGSPTAASSAPGSPTAGMLRSFASSRFFAGNGLSLTGNFARSSMDVGATGYKKGKYGSIAPSKELTDELRLARAQRTKADLAKGVETDTAPAETSNAACPMEHICCGLSVEILPCGDHPAVQHVFGNPVELATQKKKLADSAGDQHILPGMMVGLPPIAESGWEVIELPKAFKALHDEKQRQHFRLTCDAFGITFVKRFGEDHERAQVSYRKDEIPGTASEVRLRLQKLMEIDHINVARLILACEDEMEIHLIYEAQDGAGYLPMRVLSQQHLLDSGEAAKLCQQLAAATAACHRQNIQLLDWSIWNVMSMSYDNLFPMKVWGFGLAGVLHSGRTSKIPESLWIHRGAFYYMSPEICRIRSDPDVAHPFKKLDPTLKGRSDIWGLGAVVYAAMTGHPPFGGINETNVMRNVLANRADFSSGFEAVERAGVELLELMLSHAAKHRPQADAIISDAWVVGHVRAAEDKGKVEQVINNICAFAHLKPAMRTIGRVLVESIRIDKLRSLEAMFHALDIKGDGELEPHELAAFFVHRTSELRKVFRILDLNDSCSISLKEFVLANVFGQEILTERMLLRTFTYLDLDGTGEITAAELYSALKKYEPGLTPADVGELMGECDRDWDADIDFDEFRGFFPNINCASRDIDVRIQRAKDFKEVFDDTLQQLKNDIVQWKCDLAEEINKASKSRRVIERDEKGSHSESWTKDAISVLRKVLFYMRNPPVSTPPTGAPEIEKLNEEEEERKRQVAKLRKKAGADYEEDPYENLQGGPLGVDAWFKVHRASWVNTVNRLVSTAKSAQSMHSKHRKRQDCIAVLEDCGMFLKDLIQTCEEQVHEQEDLIDAAEMEERIPRPAASRRGIVIVDRQEDNTQVEIDKFMAERGKITEAKRQQELEKETRQNALIRTQFGGERRGFAWLERQAARAEEKGRPPPPGAVALKENAMKLGTLADALAMAKDKLGYSGSPSNAAAEGAAAADEAEEAPGQEDDAEDSGSSEAGSKPTDDATSSKENVSESVSGSKETVSAFAGSKEKLAASGQNVAASRLSFADDA